MKRDPDRRTILKLAGAAAMAIATGPATAAPAADIDGTILYRGGVAIPAGSLEIYLENPAIEEEALRRVAQTQIESTGGATSIAFVLSPPEGWDGSTPLRIVVRLERADGWLLARGSTSLAAGAPVSLTLSTVVY